MRAVHKYEISLSGEFEIQTSTQSGQRPALVAEQNGIPFFWLDEEVADNKFSSRSFRVYGTGHQIDSDARWMGTWLSFPFVWHLYEIR